jgi:DUF971 family protein
MRDTGCLMLNPRPKVHPASKRLASSILPQMGMTGIEPARVAPLEPKSSASANSATSPKMMALGGAIRRRSSIVAASGWRLGVRGRWRPGSLASITPLMSKNPQPIAPRDLKAVRAEGLLRIVWADRADALPFRFLRGECACAQCVNEWTGERMLDPATIPADISIERMELVGNYAVRIYWSDRHYTGLYTWERLRELGNGDAS